MRGAFRTPGWRRGTNSYSSLMPGTENGYRLAKQLLSLEDKPTAMIAINDFYAMNAYSAISDAGLEVGRDISVAGFDDIFMARFLSPALDDCALRFRCRCRERDRHAAGNTWTGKTQGVPRDIELQSAVIYRQSNLPD